MHTLFVTLACLPLEDFYKSMNLAYCITPQPRKGGGPTAKLVSCTYCGWCHFVGIGRKEVLILRRFEVCLRWIDMSFEGREKVSPKRCCAPRVRPSLISVMGQVEVQVQSRC